MGESCPANSCILPHRAICEDVVAALARQAVAWSLGDPLDPATRNGPLISEAQFARISALVATGKTEGARRVCGGEAAGRLLFRPTIFADVTPEMTIFHEEIFDPVVAVAPAESDAGAVALANRGRYGLAATLYTRDVGKAHRISRAIGAGTFPVNTCSEGEISTPFGRFGRAEPFLSGGGRDRRPKEATTRCLLCHPAHDRP